jgi:hypothetical protein
MSPGTLFRLIVTIRLIRFRCACPVQGRALSSEKPIIGTDAVCITLKVLANPSPGPGSPCGQPARGGSVALWQPWEHVPPIN